jgi:hypothetical protein
MYFKLIDIAKGAEVGRWTHREAAREDAVERVGCPLHWSSDATTLLTRQGIATFKVVKVGFRGHTSETRLVARTADDVRGCERKALVASIHWIHGKGDDPVRRDVYLLEVERQVQKAFSLEGHVGLSPDQWAEALGITQRHADCEGIEAFNHGFERGSLQGVLRMLWCNGGGSPPTTDQFLDRERSGEWYPRSCK